MLIHGSRFPLFAKRSRVASSLSLLLGLSPPLLFIISMLSRLLLLAVVVACVTAQDWVDCSQFAKRVPFRLPSRPPSPQCLLLFSELTTQSLGGEEYSFSSHGRMDYALRSLVEKQFEAPFTTFAQEFAKRNPQVILFSPSHLICSKARLNARTFRYVFLSASGFLSLSLLVFNCEVPLNHTTLPAGEPILPVRVLRVLAAPGLAQSSIFMIAGGPGEIGTANLGQFASFAATQLNADIYVIDARGVYPPLVWRCVQAVRLTDDRIAMDLCCTMG